MKKRLARIWHVIETTDTEMADASDRIRGHRERKEKLEVAAEEARGLLAGLMGLYCECFAGRS